MKIKLDISDIGSMLDRSASQLDTETAGKLQAARRAALQQQKTAQRFTLLGWFRKHSTVRHHASLGYKSLNWGMAAVLVVVLSTGIIYWQHSNDYDHSDIDIAILTDDLPVNVYVD